MFGIEEREDVAALNLGFLFLCSIALYRTLFTEFYDKGADAETPGQRVNTSGSPFRAQHFFTNRFPSTSAQK